MAVAETATKSNFVTAYCPGCKKVVTFRRPSPCRSNVVMCPYDALHTGRITNGKVELFSNPKES